MNNSKAMMEMAKSMKRFLKHKVACTMSLVTAFLITGNIGLAASADIAMLEEQVASTTETLLASIEEQRAILESMLKENEKNIKKQKDAYASLVREGDWYSKTFHPAFFLAGGFTYHKDDTQTKKDAINTVYESVNDEFRRAYEEEHYPKYGGGGAAPAGAKSPAATGVAQVPAASTGYVTSGWLAGTQSWVSYVQEYDHQSSITLKPSINPKAPSVPDAPDVKFDTPNAPATIIAPDVDPPVINSVNVTVTPPNVVAPDAPTVTVPSMNVAVSEQNINVNLTPITVTAPTVNPDINITPAIPTLTITPQDVNPVNAVSVSAPSRTVNAPSPNANPFSDFAFENTQSSKVVANSAGRNAIIQNVFFTGGTAWSGVDNTTHTTYTGSSANSSGFSGVTGTARDKSTYETSKTFTSRTSNIIYVNAVNKSTSTISGMKLYVSGRASGNTDSVTKNDGTAGGEGTIAIHTAGDLSVTNTTGYLYDKSVFISTETWQAGNISVTGSTVNINGDQNAVFYIMPSSYATLFKSDSLSSTKNGSIKVNMAVDITTSNNSIFVQSGISGAIDIKSEGLIRFEGASNIGYSGLGYVADYTKFSTVSGKDWSKFTGSLDISNLEMYGDENVALFFNTKWDETKSTLPTGWVSGGYVAGGYIDTKASLPYIGIYQNDIKIKATIGNKLSINGSTQTSKGNKTGYSNTTTDLGIGIYAASGQRTGIIPSTHLGANSSNTKGQVTDFFDGDAIHNLKIADIDIRFGSYSNNGVMILASNGTGVDVTRPDSAAITDGVNAASTTEAQASTGTIIAYATGTWKNSVHSLAGVTSSLEGQGSVINIDAPVLMTSKNGIMYFAEAGGLVNSTKTGGGNNHSVARGSESIIAYATGSGSKVTVSHNANATDMGVSTASLKYKNIGGYANSGATVEFTGNVNVNGIGAFANGKSGSIASTVTISGTGSSITTGVQGGLVALGGGTVNFGGGTITHGKYLTGATSEVQVPFYADDSSKIVFNGATTVTVNSNKAIVFNDQKDKYGGSTTASEKYAGMNNVTINLEASDVYLGLFKNVNVALTTTLQAVQMVATNIVKVAGITGTGVNTAKVGLTGGTITIDTGINYEGQNLQNIVMQNQKVEIANSGTGSVTSTGGNTITIGSDSNATSNLTSGFTIGAGGSINVSGGGAAHENAGLYVSFGHIKNAGSITVDKGAGIYGVNGSLLQNTGSITLTGDGVGIAGLARRTQGKEDYGTDKGGGALDSIPVVDINNQGTITIGGSGAAIYAENNTGVAKSRVKVANSKALTVGDNSAGIMVKGTTYGGTVNVTKDGTATADITVGNKGTGLYGENSDITITGTGYKISGKNDSVGVYLTGNSTLNGTDFTYEYNGTATGAGAGLTYVGEAASSNATNNTAITVTSTAATANTLLGVYVNSTTGTFTNNNNITANVAATNTFGIYTKGTKVVNNDGKTINVGTSASSGAIGIYAEGADVTAIATDVQVAGNKNIAFYSKGTGKILEVKAGSTAMQVVGNGSTGIYVDSGKLENASALTLTDAASATDRRIGIVLMNASSQQSTNSGDITVGKDNLGIYLNNSKLQDTGITNVTETTGTQNVGIYATGANTQLVKTSNLNVNGIKNIGIYLADGARVNMSGAMSVQSTTMGDSNYSIGVYGNGNNIQIYVTGSSTISTVGANAMGVYLEGSSSALINQKFSLSSDTSGKTAIAGYFKNGAYAESDPMVGVTGVVSITSTNTQSDASGNAVRPIGLYYATGSTQNKASVTVEAGSQDIIGIYTSGLTSTFTNSGNLVLNAKGIGAYYVNSNVANNGNVTLSADNAYGLFFKGGNSSNSGTIVATQDGSIGIIASTGATVTNSGAITVDKSSTTGGTGVAAILGGVVSNSGNITLNDGYGAVAKDTGSKITLAGGAITQKTYGSQNTTTGAIAMDGGEIVLDGANITMNTPKSGTTAGSIGVFANNGSVATFKSGNVTVANGGVGLYAVNSTASFVGYTGTITMGDGGIAIYADNSSLGSTGNLNVSYTSSGSKGVGIYYRSNTAIDNKVAVTHTGDNLVNIYADGVTLTNSGDQVVQASGIGIYAAGYTSGGVTTPSSISNTGTIQLLGDNTVGIYLADGSSLSNIGTISGTDVVNVGGTTNYRVGVYVENGSITGSSDFNFGIGGGIGMYLKSTVTGLSYNGHINVNAKSPDANNRTIGLYIDNVGAAGSPVVIDANLNVTGADALGAYLTSGSNIQYSGDITITSTSTTNRGVGAYISSGATLELVSGMTANIGGTNNIGIYIANGGTFLPTDGVITNTPDGILIYTEAQLDFSGASLQVNYANAIASSSTGKITNANILPAGTQGLMATQGGNVTNYAGATIYGYATLANAKGLVASNSGSTLLNQGNINLLGESAIGIYVQDGATATSTGHVSVGAKGVAYFANGGTINVSGTGTVGVGGTLIYGKAGTVNYTGADIDIPANTSAVTIADTSSTVDLGGHNIKVGDGATGIYVTDKGNVNNVTNVGTITSGAGGIGIYNATDSSTNSNNILDLDGANGIGILTLGGGDITYSGAITGAGNNSKGLVVYHKDTDAMGTNKIVNTGAISLSGLSSIGIFATKMDSIDNQATITVGDGANSTNVSVGIYGSEVNTIKNSAHITLGEYGVGIYGSGAAIDNSGAISNGHGNNIGIYAQGGSVTNSANITLSDNSTGIFIKDGSNLTNTANITVGDNSAGIYGSGTTSSVDLKSGYTVTVGKDSTGVANEGGESGSGTVTVENGANIIAGENSTYIYTDTGTATNNMSAELQLSNYSVGMYSKTGTVINNGSITTGQSDTSSSTEQKISVGIATKGGLATNNGTITVKEPNSIGVYAANLTDKDNNILSSGTGENNGTIKVTGNNSYGMMADGEGSKVINRAGNTINVSGNYSYGMAATGFAEAINNGTINVTGSKASGLYASNNGTVSNYGVINVKSANGIGISTGAGGLINNKGTINLEVLGAAETHEDSTTSATIGGDNGIVISSKGGVMSISIGGTILNAGQIQTVDGGTLNFEDVKLGKTDVIGTISAKYVEGEMTILSDWVKGTNKDAYVVQYIRTLNQPNEGNITAISQSASYVAELQPGKGGTDSLTVVLVKIPYATMTAGSAAASFGEGLDELYASLDIAATAGGRAQSIFDALDDISNTNELASTMETQLRGNEYANIQDRMLDMKEAVNSTIDNLRHSTLYARDEVKVGAVYTRGEASFDKVAVLDYDMNAYGAVVMQDLDTKTYGRNFGWYAAFTKNDFEFDTSNSKEEAYAINAGVNFKTILFGNDNVKWNSSLSAMAAHHSTDRVFTISNESFKNESDFYSGVAMFENAVRYEKTSENGRVTGGVQAMANLGYGMFTDVTESGDGTLVEVPSEDFFIARPGVGADVTFTARGKLGKLSLTGKASYEYELGDMYDDKGNKAHFVGTSANPWNLEKPSDDEGMLKVGAELTYTTRAGSSVGIEVVRRQGRREGMSYGLNIMKKF